MDYVRSQLLEEVRNFFAGPRSPKDPIPEGNAPLDMYTTGILFPRSAPKDELDTEGRDDGSSTEEDSQGNEESESYFRPNSIGIRTEIKDGTGKIRLEVNYGKYELDGNGTWTRYELDASARAYVLDLAEKEGEINVVGRSGQPESRIWWKIDGETVLNAFLENTLVWGSPDDAVGNSDQGEKKETNGSYEDFNKKNNENCIFHPLMSLHSCDNSSPFRPTKTGIKSYQTDEDDLFDMLYEDRKIFGSGYGCAVEWDDDHNPLCVRTSIVPIFQDNEIAKFADDESDPLKPARIDMYDLCCFNDLEDYANNRDIIRTKISPMISKYRSWIKSQTDTARKKFAGRRPYDDLSKRNLERCSSVLARIEDGYSLLTSGAEDPDNKILKSFILANRAMLLQRLHFRYALGRFKNKSDTGWPDPKKKPGQSFWYPFQLAFVLMSLRGIACRNHDDNSVADLIWFPTGGGKTEAYLGVAAFTMILRRLRREVEDGLGVSVLMRYTLRLLTLQQFERASTLICALEFLRRKVDGSGLGEQPFLLGLWVGQGLTPNHFRGSKEALENMKTDSKTELSEGSPCQTSYCPWCGQGLSPYPNYMYDPKTNWTLVRCTNNSSRCIFTDRGFSPDRILPLVTVDSDIYTRCPSMIISTVDKFARMPFRSDIASIFGRPSRRCELHGFLPREKYSGCGIIGEGVHRKGGRQKVRNVSDVFPPDLIIQDELHLISGPLGTMVGLYEAAVDFLTRTTVNGSKRRPKVIASTATIRGAQDQIRKIFDREKTLTFPPPGIDHSDSFFWWATGRKGKAFVGISFSQRSGKFSLAKLYASLLQKMEALRSSQAIEDEEIDPYWTLVGYYNSIRELGAANRLVEDDVVQTINFLAKTIHHSSRRDPGSPENGIEELTSRKTQEGIRVIRDKLERSLPSEDVISVLLATNMISVGIDIDRLALMSVNGQPKSTTEYIQATGRIGRRPEFPGIVFVTFNPYKPRDLSHYENFNGFHGMMQKYVEPSTLTPFSIPACNRALHSVFIAMIRLSNPRLAEKTAANDFRMSDGYSAREFMLRRFKSVEQVGEDSDSFKTFETALITLQEMWEKFIKDTENDASSYNDVWYNNPYNEGQEDKLNENVLMIEFAKHGKAKSDTFPRSTPESLRDVEQQIKMEYV